MPRSSARSTSSQPRRRGAATTRNDLLEAARTLFGAQGYDNTTLREIGERAGADAALIARYFGNKAALYLAAMSSEHVDIAAPTLRETVELMITYVLKRADEQGAGPVSQALMLPGIDREIREAAKARIDRRLILPLLQHMPKEDHERALRAEMAITALFGLSSVRSQGRLDPIANAPRETLISLMTDWIMCLLEPEQPATRHESYGRVLCPPAVMMRILVAVTREGTGPFHTPFPRDIR